MAKKPVIYIDGKDTRERVSQGQQRTAALSLKLAEISIIELIIRFIKSIFDMIFSRIPVPYK